MILKFLYVFHTWLKTLKMIIFVKYNLALAKKYLTKINRFEFQTCKNMRK